MSNVIDFKIYKNEIHLVGMAQCNRCEGVWTFVVERGADLTALECPKCGARDSDIMQFENQHTIVAKKLMLIHEIEKLDPIEDEDVIEDMLSIFLFD